MKLNKLFIAIAAAAAIAVAGPAPAAAQQTMGSWNLFPIFAGNAIGQIVQTRDKVFYTSANRLYSYSPEDNESYSYSIRNKLNDYKITGIYYNPQREELLVAYDTGNLDLLDLAADRTYNMSDIAETSINSLKTIHDVAFDGNRIYLGTEFGLVVYDADSHTVTESAMYGAPVSLVAVANGNLFIVPASTNKIMYSPVGSRHNTLDKFKELMDNYGTTLDGSGKDLFYCQSGNGKMYHLQLNWAEDGTAAPGNYTDLNAEGTTAVGRDADDNFVCYMPAAVAVFAPDGSEVSRRAIPASIQGQKFATRDAGKTLWGIDKNGLAGYTLADDGTVTVTMDKSRPEAMGCDRPAYLHASADGKKLYVGNVAYTQWKTITEGTVNQSDGWNIANKLDCIENGVPRNVSVTDGALMVSNHGLHAQNVNKDKAIYGGAADFVVDPQNPDRVISFTTIEGIFLIENGKVIDRMTGYQIPTKNNLSPGNVIFSACAIDPEGNLWAGGWEAGTANSPWKILPKDKLYSDWSTVTAADWKHTAHRGVDVGARDEQIVMSTRLRNPRVAFTWRYDWNGFLGIYDTKGTWGDVSDDNYFEYTTFIDQDGKSFQPTLWTCGVEDHDGRFWLGTTSGVVEVANPNDALDQNNFRITRLKVPRNDGTIYADYLLESEQINCIAVDPSNRKWVGTENSGVYLVSERGDKILEHFTTANSPLPSNCVASAWADPTSNMVYFGTTNGLVSYSSTAAPAAENLDDVYAYPNPVRPDYTGWITIKGLEDNTLVKIADAAGNVFYQTRSEGGMVVWDGCGTDGRRVKSGVYFVFASSNNNDTKHGAVTKIMVIN